MFGLLYEQVPRDVTCILKTKIYILSLILPGKFLPSLSGMENLVFQRVKTGVKTHWKGVKNIVLHPLSVSCTAADNYFTLQGCKKQASCFLEIVCFTWNKNVFIIYRDRKGQVN